MGAGFSVSMVLSRWSPGSNTHLGARVQREEEHLLLVGDLDGVALALIAPGEQHLGGQAEQGRTGVLVHLLRLLDRDPRPLLVLFPADLDLPSSWCPAFITHWSKNQSRLAYRWLSVARARSRVSTDPVWCLET